MRKKLLIILLLSLTVITACGKKTKDNEIIEQYERESITPDEEATLLARIEKLRYIDFFGRSIKTHDLKNQEVLQILNYAYEDLNNVTFSELEQKSLDYLNYYLTPEDVRCDTHSITLADNESIYTYDNGDKKYHLNVNHTGHLEIGVVVNVYDMLKESYKEGNTYTITIYKVFSEITGTPSSNLNNYYRTYKQALSKTNLLFNEPNDVKNRMTTVSSELVSYTYKFEKKNNDFYLKEYIINES